VEAQGALDLGGRGPARPEGPGLAGESGCSAFLSKTSDPGSVTDVITGLIGRSGRVTHREWQT
jgi:hypothetical protein